MPVSGRVPSATRCSRICPRYGAPRGANTSLTSNLTSRWRWICAASWGRNYSTCCTSSPSAWKLTPTAGSPWPTSVSGCVTRTSPRTERGARRRSQGTPPRPRPGPVPTLVLTPKRPLSTRNSEQPPDFQQPASTSRDTHTRQAWWRDRTILRESTLLTAAMLQVGDGRLAVRRHWPGSG